DFTTSAWDSFQSDNTTLRASLPDSNINTNNYANGVVFGSNVNPYQEDVHDNLTRFLAKKVGFPIEYANAIADADQGTDENKNTEPFASVEARENYHFTTEQRREEMKKLAYETNDIRLFGEYLHALQDSYSHQLYNIPFEENLGHIYATSLPDKTYMRPDLANQMSFHTFIELQNFSKHIGNYSGGAAWSDLKSTVNDFNLSKTLEQKYEILGE
ncbi:MAG: hypothetical protein EBS06_09505, partial [Proteobacteria bacterium]|nr:hypothetical protein [Pseudomonadota bacterium]